jgi:hypothetical protein
MFVLNAKKNAKSSGYWPLYKAGMLAAYFGALRVAYLFFESRNRIEA